MKKQLILLLAILSFGYANAQYGAKLNAFDFSTLKDKTLLIQPFGFDPKFDKEFEKKNKFDKAVSLEAKKEAYTNAWKEALATSSYDATQYEFRGYDSKKLFKEKNDKTLILFFAVDDASNRFVYMYVTGPKKLLIASTLINGLNLSKKEDIKLMFNMLNYSLNTSAEVDAEGGKIAAGSKNKYKERLVKYYDNLSDKTFLVPKFEIDTSAKNQEKEKIKTDLENEKLVDGLKAWTLSKYDLMTVDELTTRKNQNGDNSFYWRNMNFYVRINMGYGISFNVLGARINMIFTADKDEQIFQFVGGDKEFNEKTVTKLQEAFTKAAEKYKKDLAK